MLLDCLLFPVPLIFLILRFRPEFIPQCSCIFNEYKISHHFLPCQVNKLLIVTLDNDCKNKITTFKIPFLKRKYLTNCPLYLDPNPTSCTTHFRVTIHQLRNIVRSRLHTKFPPDQIATPFACLKNSRHCPEGGFKTTPTKPFPPIDQRRCFPPDTRVAFITRKMGWQTRR